MQMKQLKKIIAVIAALAIAFVFAIPSSVVRATVKSNAEILTDLGMLKGEDAGVTEEYLASQPNRLQGAILLLRLLGREAEARAYVAPEGEVNFCDADLVSGDEKAILAFLKAHPEIGFQGIGDNLFDPLSKMTAPQYNKILLVALGCTDATIGDFTKQGLSAFASSQEVIVASGNSPEEWKSKAAFICYGGEIPKALRTAIKLGQGIFKFAPGEYLIEGPTRTLWVGSDTTIIGATEIRQPDNQEDMLYPDRATQAVFITRAALPSTQQATNMQTGLIRTVSGAENITISNIALSGYTALKVDNASKCKFDHILIHNYRGIYPNGQWCNMGYGNATASFWLFGNCSNIEIQNCQIQCSSHHGLAIHSGSNEFLSKDINITGCRALYCGCGQLKGETLGMQQEAEKRVPETNGFGYYDWSVAFDFCENQSIENVTVKDCYALQGWKCGFYTEPEDTGGHIKNLKLIGCRSDLAGQRAAIPGSFPKSTIPQETEGSNFYVQGGYFENCISVKGEKCGWYMNPNRKDANAVSSESIEMLNCGDMGSPISLVTEMFDSSNLHSDGFWSLNPIGHAFWLFGTSNLKLDNTLILASNPRNPPIKIGYMLRQQFRESRSPQNLRAVAPGQKYDVLRANLTDSRITGTVYNLSGSLKPVEIVQGASFNGCTAYDPNQEIAGLDIKLASGNINIDDYVKVIAQNTAEDVTPVTPKTVFTINDVAAATVKALKMDIKDGSKTLITKLVDSGSIGADAAAASGLYIAR